MASERAAVRLLVAYWDGWQDAFPHAHRRAQWHIIHHLAAHAQQGAAMGELLGLTRQALLLDDSTVRDRVQELADAGDCVTEPAGAALAARTVIIPRPSLLARYDKTLLSLLVSLDRAAADLQPGLRLPAPHGLTDSARALALEALGLLTQGWSNLLDRLFDAANLSTARRMEARRNLLSTSHRTLLLTAIELHHGLLPQAEAEGILADRLAAQLLERTGQNFQTTRDHIAYLLSLDLLDRRAGRALSVSLTKAAAAQIDLALTDLAASLAALVRRAGTPESGSVALRIMIRNEPPRLVPIDATPFTIGRTEVNSLQLPAGDVSRTHCQITLRGGETLIEDMGSTNGTSVNGQRITAATALHDGARITIGPFDLIFVAPEEEDMSDSTIRRAPGMAALG